MTIESGTSEDGILDGALRIRQPLRGHRVGHDAILLAAATQARPGDRAVELGAGVGAAGLALAARTPGMQLTMIEIDPGLCELAEANAKLNSLDARVIVRCADVEDIAALESAGVLSESFDRVLMNPPFLESQRHQPSPDQRRRLAYLGAPGLLSRWIDSAVFLLKPGGVLTMIWRADSVDDVHEVLRLAMGGIAVQRAHPRPGAPPIRVLIRATKGEAGGQWEYPPLFLTDELGRPSPTAEAILRGREILEIAKA
ncbi:MAG TPA: methyltransferase [Pseudolabrys sp.]|nr:methyltransferase [Pseudolabrys sp.]